LEKIKDKKNISKMNPKIYAQQKKQNEKENNLNGKQININQNNINNNNKSVDRNINNITTDLEKQANNVRLKDNKKEKKIYSYECINIVSLIIYLYKGTNEAQINIFLKNNGNEIWTINNTKLIFDEESDIKGEDIILGPQKPNEEKKYLIVFKNLEKYDIGEYKSYVWFYAEGETVGEKLTITINIKEDNAIKNEIDKCMDKIKDFRESFSLPQDEISDETIIEKLKENDFDYEKTFNAIFD
jgi:hypothetical protein